MPNKQFPMESNTSQWQLITEKIALPTATASVRRPRLLALLDQSLRSCTSTIITGRAGSGKTSLAIDFADQCERRVAWYKVDAPETQLRIFFEYLISSIYAKRPGFGSYSLCSLIDQSFETHQIPLLADVFLYELQLQSAHPLLIVIEDLHLVCDAEWLVPFFRRLLTVLPADVHVIITSRTMPPASFWRMRSKQTLSVIDEEMLLFSAQEALTLFEYYGLTHEQAAVAMEHSRGRAASLSDLAATLHFAEGATRSETSLV